MTLRQKRRVRITRDGILFVAGLGGLVHEVLREGTERPTLLFMFAAMMGLPAFLQKDEKNKGKDKADE